MDDLIARLEKATAPSRRLDAEIIAVIKGGAPEDYEATSWALPRLTESLDAALTLVPEGCDAAVHVYPDGCGNAHVYRMDDPPSEMAEGRNPALALCIAALKARQVGQ